LLCLILPIRDSLPTEFYSLSLHDALPICRATTRHRPRPASYRRAAGPIEDRPRFAARHPTSDRTSVRTPCSRTTRRPRPNNTTRSEEHTSELQSRENLVCRLLLEKKN